MLKSLALAAALALGGGSAAFADVVATLQSPLEKPAKIVAGGAVWTCADSTCSADNGETRTVSVSACRDLGREVGPVASYAADGRPFAPAEMAKCNAGLKGAATLTAQTAAPASR